MNHISEFADKMVLGTVQFGTDYGIANVSGKPAKKEIFKILLHAYEKGVWKFDTAPGYGSESLLGEFFSTNGLQNKVKALTKLPSLNGLFDKGRITKNIELSLKNIGCPIDVLFFHDPTDSILLMENPEFFEDVLRDYPISSIGVSVYEPSDIEKLSLCTLELAFQFPFNVLDKRFEKTSMFPGKRYARSIFLQGLLASKSDLRLNAPLELINLQKQYHHSIDKHNLNPISFSISYALLSNIVDHVVIGVDSLKQFNEIINFNQYDQNQIENFDFKSLKINNFWIDPRNWRKNE